MSTEARAYPAYVDLLESGELERRAEKAAALLENCRVCPRRCGAKRLEGAVGTCRTEKSARVASHFAHRGEENCLRGWRGSGTIFFSGCNLLCAFCQNWDTSHDCQGEITSPRRIADMMLELEAAGCHNVNWVTPTHVVPQLLEALALAARGGLRLPLVYNTGAYDSLESLRLLDGVIDIYMPDFKLWDPESSDRFLGARDYPNVARQAIKEMHRQVGDLVMDPEGIARRGLLVRHLVMPGGSADTREVAAWLAREISSETYVNVLGQYHPDGDVLFGEEGAYYRDIDRPITSGEYREALQMAREAGLHRLDG